MEPGANRRRGFAAFGIRSLVKDFQTDLQVVGDLTRDDQSGLAEVLGIAAAIDFAAATAKCRPWTLVQPSENEGLILAQAVRGFASIVQRKGFAMVALK